MMPFEQEGAYSKQWWPTWRDLQQNQWQNMLAILAKLICFQSVISDTFWLQITTTDWKGDKLAL